MKPVSDIYETGFGFSGFLHLIGETETTDADADLESVTCLFVMELAVSESLLSIVVFRNLAASQDSQNKGARRRN